MANVSIEIPDLLGGYSQIPDIKKGINEVNEFKNVYPDFTFGTSKRPGCQILATLNLNDASAYNWSVIDKYETPYLCGIGNGEVRIFVAFSGQEITVTDVSGGSYLTLPTGYNAWSSFKVLQLEKGTIVVNKTITVLASDVLTTGNLKGAVTTMTDLPADPVVDDIYHVENTNTADDDIYVIWNDEAWVETTKPGESVGIDANTMPHGITRALDGSFLFGPLAYANRKVGEISPGRTNPQPSFVGLPINNVFGYLNRIGFLAGSNVIMSQPLLPDNQSLTQTAAIDFFFQSTFTLTDADPIDINVSTVRDIELSSVAPSRQGLALFADREQFLMYSDSGVITPNSAAVRGISTWEMNPELDVVELGSEFYFIGGRKPYNRYSRLLQMITRGLEEDPIVTDVSKNVAEWMPSGFTTLVSSTQEQWIAASKLDEKKVYFFRRYKEGGETVMQNWFEWEFNFNLVGFIPVNSNLYFVGQSGTDVFIGFVNLNQAPTKLIVEGGQSTFNVLPVRPYTDLYCKPASVTVTDKKSIITPPAEFPIIDNGYNVIAILTREDVTKQTLFLDGYEPGFHAVLTYDADQGVFTGPPVFAEYPERVIIGYQYTMAIELPKYFVNNDFTSYTTIARYKIAATLTGALGFYIKQLGRQSWAPLQEVSDADFFYEANTIPVASEKMFVLPIHQRNTNFRMAMRSTSPFPVVISSLRWEGQYMPRNYRRQ